MDGVLARKIVNDIKKEMFRKSIHLCTAFVPLLLAVAKWPVIGLLMLALILYSISEMLRLRGVRIPLVAHITETAARKRDEGRFVLGPCTLCIGVILSSMLFPEKCASCGILALAFGDGLASLVGKIAGRRELPLMGGKTAEGSLACFGAIFLAIALFVVPDAKAALILALVGTGIEMLPLKDFDNILIPVVISALAHFCFGF